MYVLKGHTAQDSFIGYNVRYVHAHARIKWNLLTEKCQS